MCDHSGARARATRAHATCARAGRVCTRPVAPSDDRRSTRAGCGYPSMHPGACTLARTHVVGYPRQACRPTWPPIHKSGRVRKSRPARAQVAICARTRATRLVFGRPDILACGWACLAVQPLWPYWGPAYVVTLTRFKADAHGLPSRARARATGRMHATRAALGQSGDHPCWCASSYMHPWTRTLGVAHVSGYSPRWSAGPSRQLHFSDGAYTVEVTGCVGGSVTMEGVVGRIQLPYQCRPYNNWFMFE